MGRGKNRGRRMRKEAERQAHDDLSDAELDAALAEITQGSDRVAAIMGGALVQNVLMGALVICLEDQGDLTKVFDSVRGPLNSFYSQIVMGKALGLFDEKIADALHAVRSIRNKFAHAVVTMTFQEPEVAKKCASLAWLQDENLRTDGISEERRYFEQACLELTCQCMAAGSARLIQKADHMRNELAFELMSRRKNQLGKLNNLLELIPASVESGE